MIDYKSLFYKSQVEIADAIEALGEISEKLKKCTQECEKVVVSESDLKIHTKE